MRSASPNADRVAAEINAFVTELGGSGRVLETGSGGGRDARELEKRGISVRRTDVSSGFVELLRGTGFEGDGTQPPNVWLLSDVRSADRSCGA